MLANLALVLIHAYLLDCIRGVSYLSFTRTFIEDLHPGSLLCTFSVFVTTDALWYFVFGMLFQRGSQSSPPW